MTRNSRCVFLQRVYTSSKISSQDAAAPQSSKKTFCELTARFHFAASDCGSTVPRKMDLNWFIPAFVKRSVGSERGTTEDDGTIWQISDSQFYGPVNSRTKCVTIFFEVVKKCISYAHGTPFVLSVHLRSHDCGSTQLCGREVEKVSRREYFSNTGVTQTTIIFPTTLPQPASAHESAALSNGTPVPTSDIRFSTLELNR